MFRPLVASAFLVAATLSAAAAPARIVILTNAEAANAFKLCETGSDRAKALRFNYLGYQAEKTFFSDDQPPAYFFAITPLTVATATDAADSWRKPIIHYSVVPEEAAEDMEEALHKRTRQAARNILNNPALREKTVVMVWERRHIADPEYDKKFEREAAVTLRQLLKLDILPGVPREWPEDNHDYFWIVDFPKNSNVPLTFKMVKQEFGKSFPNVPANDWGEPSGLAADSGCEAVP